MISLIVGRGAEESRLGLPLRGGPPVSHLGLPASPGIPRMPALVGTLPALVGTLPAHGVGSRLKPGADADDATGIGMIRVRDNGAWGETGETS